MDGRERIEQAFPLLAAFAADPELAGGCDSTDVARISHDAVPLRELRMVILWCQQPDLLRDMFAKRILTDNGFLPRVLPCLVDSTPMPIDTKTRRVSDKTKADWHDLVRGLFTAYHSKMGEPFTLRRIDKAQSVIVDYYNSIIERRQSELADVGPFAARRRNTLGGLWSSCTLAPMDRRLTRNL